MTNNLFDFQDYKKAKLIMRDLTDLLNIIIKFKKELSPYAKYTFVKEIYSMLMNSQATVQMWLNKCNNVIEQKGSINDKVEAIKKANSQSGSNKT